MTASLQSLLSVGYYGLMGGCLAFLALWEDGGPLVHGAQRRRLHIARNLCLFVLAVAVADGLVGTLLLDMPTRLFSTPPGLLTPLDLPLAGQLAIAFVAMDLLSYGSHRLFHATRWLWLIHAVHHADPHVDVSTSLRHHPLEVALDVALKLGCYLALGLPLWIEGARTLLINPLVMFQHANIAYPAWFVRPARWLVVTPAIHRVHHLPDEADTNSNFGQLLTVWDRLFGTYRQPDPAREPRFGLRQLADDSYQSVAGMLLTPWRARRLPVL